jgi:hypothetical protein
MDVKRLKSEEEVEQLSEEDRRLVEQSLKEKEEYEQRKALKK